MFKVMQRIAGFLGADLGLVGSQRGLAHLFGELFLRRVDSFRALGVGEVLQHFLLQFFQIDSLRSVFCRLRRRTLLSHDWPLTTGPRSLRASPRPLSWCCAIWNSKIYRSNRPTAELTGLPPAEEPMVEPNAFDEKLTGGNSGSTSCSVSSNRKMLT